MEFFDLKAICSVCDKTIGLTRFQLSKNVWICPNCLTRLGGTSAFPYLRTKSISELKNMLNPQINSNVTTMNNNQNDIEEIKKYKKLLELGAITQEEFEKKKKQLLNIEEKNNTEVKEITANNSNTENHSNPKQKNKWIAFFLCLFLGLWGGHKFYEGKIGMGFLYMFTSGLFSIGWLIDLIKILIKPNLYYI